MIIFDVVRAALFSNATYEFQSKHKKKDSAYPFLTMLCQYPWIGDQKLKTENSRRMHLYLPDRAINLT